MSLNQLPTQKEFSEDKEKVLRDAFSPPIHSIHTTLLYSEREMIIMVVSVRDVFDLIVYLYRWATTERFDDLEKKAWMDTLSYFEVPPMKISEFCDKDVNFELNKLKTGVQEIEILPLVKKLVHLKEFTYSEVDPQQFILTFLNNLRKRMKMHPNYSKVITQRIEYESGRIDPWDIGYQQLVEACKEQVQKHLLKMKAKYDRSLYVKRTIEEQFRRFMSSDNKCFLVVDRAGMGKTNFTCWAAEEYGKENPTIILSGSMTLSRERDLEKSISEEVTHFLNIPTLIRIDELAEIVKIRNTIEEKLHQEQIYKDLDVQKIFKSESKKEKRFLLVIVDGINENENRRAMKYALQDLLCESAGKDIKVLITCREIFWEYFDDEFWKEFVYEPDISSERPWIFITEFNDCQFDQAWEKYKSRYHVEGELLSEAREKCKHPLMLRFFCEAYYRENIDLCRNFTKKEVFDKYWEKKLKRIESDLHYRYSQQDIARFLLKIAEEMKNKTIKNLTGDKITKITGITDFISPDSIYRRILDEDIILEEEIGETGRRVSFTYENFMEYAIAKSILEQWRGKADETVLNQFEKLGNQAQDFENLYGVIDYLVIMMDEYKDLQMAMVQKTSEWRSSFLDSISVLDILPDNTFDILLRFAMSERISLRHRVAQILKKFIKDYPEECVKIVEQLAEQPDERTQEIIIPYLVELANLFPEKAFHLLERLSESIKAQEAIEEICPLCTDLVLDMIQRWGRCKVRDNEQLVYRLLITTAEQQPENTILILNELKNNRYFSVGNWEFAVLQILNQEFDGKKQFVETFCEMGDLQIQRLILFCLKNLIDQNNEEILSILSKWSESENPRLREISAGLLGRVDKSKTFQILPILERLCCDENVRVRIAVCNSLAEIAECDPSSVHRILLEMIQDRNFGDPLEISEIEHDILQLDDATFKTYRDYFSLKSSIITVLWEIWRQEDENILDIFGSKESLHSLVKRSVTGLPHEILEELEETIPQEIEADILITRLLSPRKGQGSVIKKGVHVFMSSLAFSYHDPFSLFIAFCCAITCSAIDYWMLDIGILKVLITSLNLNLSVSILILGILVIIILSFSVLFIRRREEEFLDAELLFPLEKDIIWKKEEAVEPEPSAEKGGKAEDETPLDVIKKRLGEIEKEEESDLEYLFPEVSKKELELEKSVFSEELITSERSIHKIQKKTENEKFTDEKPPEIPDLEELIENSSKISDIQELPKEIDSSIFLYDIESIVLFSLFLFLNSLPIIIIDHSWLLKSQFISTEVFSLFLACICVTLFLVLLFKMSCWIFREFRTEEEIFEWELLPPPERDIIWKKEEAVEPELSAEKGGKAEDETPLDVIEKRLGEIEKEEESDLEYLFSEVSEKELELDGIPRRIR